MSQGFHDMQAGHAALGADGSGPFETGFLLDAGPDWLGARAALAPTAYAKVWKVLALGFAMRPGNGRPQRRMETLGYLDAKGLGYALQRRMHAGRPEAGVLLVFDIAGSMEEVVFAELLRIGVRETDLRARLSSTLFAAVLWDADEDAGKLVADGLWMMAGGGREGASGPFRYGLAGQAGDGPDGMLARALQNLKAAPSE